MNAPSRFWVIRYPSGQGDVIAKFDTQAETIIPTEIADYGDFVVQQVPDRSAIVSETVDQSGLTDAEVERLESVYSDIR